MSKNYKRHVFVLLALVLAARVSSAQTPAVQDPQAQAAPPPTEVAPDSPRASFQAYLDAAGAGQWERAARYLVLNDDQRTRAATMAERLKGVIDTLRVADAESVSPESTGRQDDNLPADVEEIGQVSVTGRQEPVRLVRQRDAEGVFWAFAPATVARIDTWYEALPDRWLRDWLTRAGLDVLLLPGFFDILWWQWIALPIVGLVSWAAGRMLRAVTRPIISRLTSRTTNTWDDELVARLGPPLTLAFAVLVFALGARPLHLTLEASQFVGSLLRATFVFALFWGLWRATGVVTAWIISRPWAAANPSTMNLLSIGANIWRGLVAGTGILAMLAALGYPIGTALAGLGIGGLALAFGAQKTIENVFGSISLAVDQPFRVGDFVKVEDFVGTVENIGLRSTRFRTLDRTVVSIPNGKLSDQRLESFQVRDRMRLATTIGVTYGTTRTQMQAVLEGLERALRAHPKIWSEAVVVKFKEFGPSSLDIEIMAWFEVPTWGDFQQCRQEVLLEFMRVVEEAGTSFAFPTRTVHLVQDTPPSVPRP